ncbi:hypothetical protein L6258_01630, partial [Candidatus Parcubacteria bacterium]|nr:hypothetical protein [Candidatus Parcubacteria bacterium]
LDGKSARGGQILIGKSFVKANEEIRKLNEKLGIDSRTVDYINKQYAATVGCFGFVGDGKFYFGQINDCGIASFDPQGKREIDAVLNQTPLLKHLEKMEGEGRFEAGSKEEHIYVRSRIVNDSQATHDGEHIDFGVMTGEARAKNFLHMGAINLYREQTIVLYSDGFIPFVRDPEFVELLTREPEKKIVLNFTKASEAVGEEFRKEKSLIVIRIKGS